MSPLALERCASTEVSKPDESKVMMLEILNNPRDFDMGFERYSCSLMSILGWGRRIASKGDYTLKLAIKMMDDITMMQVPGEYWMEAIPEMQYLPTWIYPLPAQIRAFGKKLRKYWWALDLEGAEANEPNFSKTLVKSKEEYGLSQDDIGEMTTNLIGGGLDTSSSTLHSCILALCVFKEVQQKAQEEIDRVIGHDRTPDWADLDNLPYCNAIFKETMRWRSVTTLGGFAHSPIRDDYYRGFFFPAGIHVYGNLWAIHRDPKDFPDLDVFKPERFLEGNRLSYPNKQGHNAFGWGRRSCSGKPFAEQGLPMSIVRLLWSFHIQPGLNERVR
jgi:cytochrome P450